MIVTSVCTLSALRVQAALLDPTQLPPDIVSGYIDVDYDGNAGLFTAHGYTIALDLDFSNPPDYMITGNPRAFDLQMTINPLTAALINGTVSFGGRIPALGAMSDTLLTGTITDFGFQTGPNSQVFDFRFSVTGGDLASLFGTVSWVILNGVSINGFDGTFDQDFSNRSNGTTDCFAGVPEPSTGVLAMICSLAWGASRLSRRRLRAAG
jgi:hypothetical protein